MICIELSRYEVSDMPRIQDVCDFCSDPEKFGQCAACMIKTQKPLYEFAKEFYEQDRILGIDLDSSKNQLIVWTLGDRGRAIRNYLPFSKYIKFIPPCNNFGQKYAQAIQKFWADAFDDDPKEMLVCGSIIDDKMILIIQDPTNPAAYVWEWIGAYQYLTHDFDILYYKFLR